MLRRYLRLDADEPPATELSSWGYTTSRRWLHISTSIIKLDSTQVTPSSSVLNLGMVSHSDLVMRTNVQWTVSPVSPFYLNGSVFVDQFYCADPCQLSPQLIRLHYATLVGLPIYLKR